MTEVFILGSKWTIHRSTKREFPILENVDGYCDWTVRKIVVDWEEPNDIDHLEDIEAYHKKVLRHEIVHAFLKECGLMENSSESHAWADNEEMVDWFAAMGERIHQAWVDADCRH